MPKRSERKSERPKASPTGTLRLDHRHLIELLNVLVPPAEGRQRWSEFRSRLEADAPQQVLERYTKRGGNRLALEGCLHQLSSRMVADDRSFRQFKKCARFCLKAIEALLKIQEQVPETVVCIARMLRGELGQAYQARLTYENGKVFTEDFVKQGRSKKGGRPVGSQSSLLLCVIGEEFNRRFRSPRYGDILVLAKAANPCKFPDTTTSEHIRQRIRDFQHANQSLAEEFHKKFFPVTNP